MTKAPRKLTPEQKAEIDRLNRIADEAVARGDFDAAVDAGHEAMIFLMAIADVPIGDA